MSKERGPESRPEKKPAADKRQKTKEALGYIGVKGARKK